MLQTAADAEKYAFPALFPECPTVDGRAAIVGRGDHPQRAVQTMFAPVAAPVPKVWAKNGAPVTCRLVLVPPEVRQAGSIEAALPRLYLKGISTG